MLERRRSLAGRVGLLATVAVGLSVAFAAVAGYATVNHQLIAGIDYSLLQRAHAAAQSPALRDLSIPSSMTGAADVRIAYVTPTGVETSDLVPPHQRIEIGAEELAVARGEEKWSTRTVETDDGPYRVAAVPYRDPGVALVLAQSLEPTEYTLEHLGVVLLIFGGAGVVAAGLAGWAVARNGLSPLRRLTEAAEEIARTENLEPIEVEGTDEVARLASAFNTMLTSLAASRDRQRRLVADAGHELRTPLTSLRTNLDLLGQAETRGGLDAPARQELLADVRFQIEELTTLIGDLTELARDDPMPRGVEPVDLAEVVEHGVERVRRRAPDLRFDVSLLPWWVTGDATALERAVTNLLDNAAKWSPPEGTVTVRLAEGTLYVADQGSGIAAQDLPHVFDRFYRSTAARTLPGSGLGLSIVRRAAERHGGSVAAGQAPGGGAAFRFSVPGVTQRPRSSDLTADRPRA